MISLSHELLTIEITLDQIAARAEVTVQTVLRHFGSRDALFTHVLAAASQQVSEQRRVSPGDIDAALAALSAHYEEWGELMVRLVAAETSDERIMEFTNQGRSVHRQWVQETFAPQLAGLADDITDLLAVATDLQVWSLLRRDRGLDATTVAKRTRRMVDAVLSLPHRKDPS
ncbi:TetR/AcrR family transcriptional regulator [Demequina sp.]|uniref:TetR/AcrR family transcriptional regulator n=1 Tax=Demequina sp. TaxID=2050685 RepID=UPI0025FB7B14|nr:TetR/AcrR family transcriptional regulator [Demequina sp.]